MLANKLYVLFLRYVVWPLVMNALQYLHCFFYFLLINNEKLTFRAAK